MKKLNAFSDKAFAGKSFLFKYSVGSFLLIAIYAVWFVCVTICPYYDNGISLEITRLLHLEDSIIYFSAMWGTNSNCLIIIPFLIGLLNFSFLHNKSLCYTTLSFASTRKRIFINRFFIPVAAIVLITISVKLVTLKLNYDVYSFDSVLLEAFFAHILTYVKIILFSAFCAVFACLLCGRTIEAVASGISLFFLPTVLGAVVRFINELTLFGASIYSETLLTDIVDSLNPFDTEQYFDLYYCYGETAPLYKSIVLSTLWISAFSVALCLLGHYFSKQYKPENSGFKGHSRFLSVIISCTLPLVAVGIFFEEFAFYMDDFNYLPDTLLKYSLSALVVLALCALLCNAVVFISLKHIKYAVIGIASCLAVSGLLAGINSTDVFGTFNKLPEKEDIKEISLSIPYDDFFSVFSYEANVFNHHLSEPNSTMVFHSEEEKDIIINFHEKIIDNKDKDSNIRAIFSYTLKNDETIYREYACLSYEAVKEIASLRSSTVGEKYLKETLLPEVYFESSTPVVVDTQKTGLQISSNYGSSETFANLTITKEQFRSLREAVLKDLTTIPNEKWYYQSSESLGTLDFFINFYYADNIEFDYIQAFSTHIFSSMENTIRVLKELGYYNLLFDTATIKEAYIIPLENVAQSHITGPVFSTSGALDFITEIPDTYLKKTDNIDEINKLLEKAHPYYLLNDNKQGNLLLVVFQDGEITEIQTFYIPN